MPWETSDRKSELPADWPQRRQRVGDRDGWKCQWPRSARGICGSTANQCDHRGDPWDHDESALWMLCEWHHKQKTGQESAAARRVIAAKAYHPVEQVPLRRR